MRRLSNVACIAVIVGSIFVSTGVGFSLFRVFRSFRVNRLMSQEYCIDTIVQTGPEKGALLTGFLAEAMGLSADHPVNFFMLDEEVARENLLQLPVIEEALVRKIKPSTVYVDYTVRQPVATLGDFENHALDRSGTVFPLSPYYSPKRIPEFYLGIDECLPQLKGNRVDLAFVVLELLSRQEFGEGVQISRIDVSNAFSESYGRREIVAILTVKGSNLYLRLSPRQYVNEVAHYLTIHERVVREIHEGFDKIIELRIPKLAYVDDYCVSESKGEV